MPDSMQKVFLQAVAAHQAKDYAEAGRLCQIVLHGALSHAGCLYILGVTAFALGHAGEAETLMRRALAANPPLPEMHFGFGQILAAQGKYADATAAFTRALELNPQHAEVSHALGCAHKALRQYDEALRLLSWAIRVRPNYPEALNSLGILFYEQDKYADSIAQWERALRLRPAFPEVLNNLGVAYGEIRDFPRAMDYCARAIALQPDYAAAYNSLGNILRVQGRLAEARDAYNRSLELAPQTVEARNNLGLVLLELDGDPDTAAACFREILQTHPEHVAALTHLGITYCHKGDFAEGIECYEQALAIQPDCRGALNNLGNALRATGHLPAAVAAYRRAVEIMPDDAEGHNNLAMSLLAAGNFKEGWPEYEWRWRTGQLAAARRDLPQPQWRGEDAAGKTLLIHAEQGFGDTLQFCRYATLAAARGLRVVMEVQPSLVRLLQSMQGVEAVIARGDSLPVFDLHCPMMSLPQAFGTRVETIPWDGPYLAATLAAVAAWREKIGHDTARKVGLIWAGNPRLFSSDLAAANRRRSIAPQLLEPLMGTANTVFYSLQKEGPPAPDMFGLVDFMPQCVDFADTAALIANLDLVISVDTAVAHLAGAMGKPVWLLNRYDSCWRWLQNRDDSPWYPTMRLFHQPPGDWPGVIARVRAALDVKQVNKLDRI